MDSVLCQIDERWEEAVVKKKFRKERDRGRGRERKREGKGEEGGEREGRERRGEGMEEKRKRKKGVRLLKRTFMITYDTLGCCNLRFLFLVKEKEGRGAELRRAFLRKYLTPFRFRSADSTVHVSSTMSQKHAPWVGGEEAGRGWKPRR